MTIPSRPQPYYARFNQPPRSPSNGRNRQAAPTNHSDPLDGADPSAGGADSPTMRTSIPATTWRTINHPVFPFAPGPNSSLSLADYAKLMDDIARDMTDQFNQIVFCGRALPSPPTIPYAGVTSGEITGYRGWIVCDEPTGPTLCSLAHRFLWEPNATIEGNLTECVNNYAFNPVFGGVYAFREFSGLMTEIAEAQLYAWLMRRHKGPFIEQHTWLGFAHGTVKLWGETVEHETGYRASFAKLTSIDSFIGVDGFDLAALRQRYGV